MKVESNNFIAAASIGIADADMQAAVQFATDNASGKRLKTLFAHSVEHGEAMRMQAAAAKRRALRDLPELLEQAEANMIENGITVLWAENAEEANGYILEIAQRHDVKNVVKGKSMVSEETALNHFLQEHGLSVVESDLGEFIAQLNDEPPSHIVMPVLHKTKASVRDLFVEKLNMPFTDDAEEMTAFARIRLRDVFLNADMGITGGNFVIAETGTLGLVTNEGNGRMSSSKPRVHVALTGIEKIVPTLEDYATLTQILPRSATGQPITVYTHMINGPRRLDEPDGPDHVYVILMDNGRSKIFQTDYAEVLACIRCGACQNSCPVYNSTGGHAYGWVYAGPIGAVLTPLLTGLENAKPLPNASSLCGRCKQVCPVDIDLPRMLLDLRHDLVEQGKTEIVWNVAMKAWAIGNRSPRLFEMGGRVSRMGTRSPLMPKSLPGPLGGWTKYRDFPEFAPKSFRQMWRERQKASKS
jgi:L-lactate dehydrogenase complex protein LldF